MNIHRLFLAAAFIFAWFSLFTLIAAAQGIHGIKGKVADEKTGQPIAKAQVIFQAMDAVLNLITKTNEKGEYTGLLGGKGRSFRIIVQAQGYQSQYRENVRSEPKEMREENFSLVAGVDSPATESLIQGLRQFEKGGYENPALQQFLEKYLKTIKKPERLHVPEYLQDLS